MMHEDTKLTTSLSASMSLSPGILMFPTHRSVDPVPFAIDERSMSKFGPWRSGDVVKVTKGKETGISATIIGVRNGYLWRKREDYYGATAFSAWSEKDLKNKYGLEKVGVTIIDAAPVRVREDIRTLTAVVEPVASTEKHPYKYYIGPDLQPTTLDIHQSLLDKYGVTNGNRVLQHNGVISVVIGMYNGMLWIHDETDGFPRPWEAAVGEQPSQQQPQPLMVIGQTTLRNTSDTSFVYSHRDYDISESSLRNFGYVHGARVQHNTGPRKDSIGIILGTRSGCLWEVCEHNMADPQPLGSSEAEVNSVHNLTVIGLYCGKLRPPSWPTLYSFPVPGTTKNFDIRTSACMEFGVCHGQAVLIYLGPQHGTVARVVGVRNGKVWGVSDWHQGCFVLEPGTYKVMPRPTLYLLRTAPSPRVVVKRPTIFGEVVSFDASFEACARFRFLSGHLLILADRKHLTEGTAATDGAMLRWQDELPPGWFRAIVIGVHLHELWVCRQNELTTFPLRGTTVEALRSSYVWYIKGMSPIDPIYDPFLSDEDVPCAAFKEPAVQDIPGVKVLIATDGSTVAVDTTHEAFQRVECPQLKSGDVIEHRVTSEVPRVLSVLHRGLKQKSFEHEVCNYYTIAGVCGTQIYYHDEEDGSLQCREAVEFQQSVPLSSSHIPKEIMTRKQADGMSAGDLACIDDYVPSDPQPVPETLFSDHIGSITATQLKEMEFKFFLLPRSCHLEAFTWVLSFYDVRLKPFEGREHALRRLAVIEIYSHQTITSPTFGQWCKRACFNMEEEERRARASIEYEWKERNYTFTYKAQDLLKRWTCDQDISVNISSAFPTRRRSIAELVRITLELDEEGGSVHRSNRSEECSMSTISADMPVFNPLPRVSHARPSIAEGLLRDGGGQKSDHIELEKLREAVQCAVWPFLYFRQGCPMILDISVEACSRFGFEHGDVLEYGVGDTEGMLTYIVGVFGGQLWRYDENQPTIFPFEGRTKESIMARHRLHFVKSKFPVRKADPFYFHSGTGEWMSFDIQHDVLMSAANVSHGERYLATKGPYSGRILSILGLHAGTLWFCIDWSGATCVAQVTSLSDLRSEWGLQFLYTARIRTICDMPKETAMLFSTTSENEECYDVSYETCRWFGCLPGQKVRHLRSRDGLTIGTIIGVKNGRMYQQSNNGRLIVSIDCTPQQLSESQMELLSWTRPAYRELVVGNASNERSTIKFLSATKHVCFFDITEAACYRVFKVRHGDHITYSVHAHSLNPTKAVIVGVREGYLWKCDEGQEHATVFHGCRDVKDLRATWHVTVLEPGTLEECTG